jgi:hypothetical protein
MWLSILVEAICKNLGDIAKNPIIDIRLNRSKYSLAENWQTLELSYTTYENSDKERDMLRDLPQFN